MAFEKIKVTLSEEDALELAHKLIKNYYQRDNDLLSPETLLEAMKEEILNIKVPFDENKWNSCETKPPVGCEYVDLIFRKKGTNCLENINATNEDAAGYRTGWHDALRFALPNVYKDRNEIQANINDHPEKWEYKIIKHH